MNGVQAFMVAFAIIAGYLGYLYLPVGLDWNAMNEICRRMAYRMVVDFDDKKMVDEILAEAKGRKMSLGASQVKLTRQLTPIVDTCVITWKEQPHPFWSKNQVLDMSVTQHAAPGKL